jgi:type IV secretion system protein VirB1
MSALSLALIAQLAATPACTVPGMVPEFWPNVIKAESHYDPNAIGDDTAARSYYPDTADTAEALALKLMAQGHSVGVGLSQLTARSPEEFSAKFGLTIREALEDCRNMQAGARFYVTGALSIYNTGHPTKGIGYAKRIMASVGTAAVRSVPLAPMTRVNRHASDTEAW